MKASKTGKRYRYYICKKARKKQCDKRIIDKDVIENLVVEQCLKLLDKESIEYIAKSVSKACESKEESYIVKDLKKKLSETETAINNLFIALEKGDASELILNRLNQRQDEKKQLEKALSVEESKQIKISEAQVKAFLKYIAQKPIDDLNKKRALINIFVHSIYLYDDHFNIILNGSKKHLNINDIPVKMINQTLNDEKNVDCSTIATSAPPHVNKSFR